MIFCTNIVFAYQTHIELIIGSKKAIVNDKEYILSEPPTIINGTTMVPLKFVKDVLAPDYMLSWNADLKKIDLWKNNSTDTIVSFRIDSSTSETSTLIINPTTHKKYIKIIFSGIFKTNDGIIECIIENRSNGQQNKTINAKAAGELFDDSIDFEVQCGILPTTINYKNIEIADISIMESDNSNFLP